MHAEGFASKSCREGKALEESKCSKVEESWLGVLGESVFRMLGLLGSIKSPWETMSKSLPILCCSPTLYFSTPREGSQPA